MHSSHSVILSKFNPCNPATSRHRFLFAGLATLNRLTLVTPNYKHPKNCYCCSDVVTKFHAIEAQRCSSTVSGSIFTIIPSLPPSQTTFLFCFRSRTWARRSVTGPVHVRANRNMLASHFRQNDASQIWRSSTVPSNPTHVADRLGYSCSDGWLQLGKNAVTAATGTARAPLQILHPYCFAHCLAESDSTF